MGITTCAFTGHRPNRFKFGYDEEHPDCVKLKLVLLQQIETLYQNGVTRFLTGCALGVDTWTAEIVIGLMELHKNIELFCIIPYEEQAARWSPQQRERYYTILEKSTCNKLICTHYTNDCYSKRNRFLVDYSNILLAVYDTTEKGKSGTGHTVAYARQKGKGIICIDPDTARVTPITIKTV